MLQSIITNNSLAIEIKAWPGSRSSEWFRKNDVVQKNGIKIIFQCCCGMEFVLPEFESESWIVFRLCQQIHLAPDSIAES